MRYTQKISLWLSACTLCTNAATAQYEYAITTSDKVITIESRSSGKTDLGPQDIARKKYGIELDLSDYLGTNDAETTITLQTPNGPGRCILRANTRSKVREILNSGTCSLQKNGAAWDMLIGIRKYYSKHETKPAQTEYGGTSVGTKEASYTDLGSKIRPDDQAKLSKLNDSLAKNGIRDSTSIYLHNAFFLEKADYMAAAKKDYRKAFNYSIKTNGDTAIIGMINRDFAARAAGTNSEKKKREQQRLC